MAGFTFLSNDPYFLKMCVVCEKDPKLLFTTVITREAPFSDESGDHAQSKSWFVIGTWTCWAYAMLNTE